MANRGAGCMGKPLVRFCEGQEFNCDMEEILWHRRESRRQRRKQTSSCSHGRLLSTRKYRNDGLRGRKTINLFFLAFDTQYSNIPSFHFSSKLRSWTTVFPQKFRRFQFFKRSPKRRSIVPIPVGDGEPPVLAQCPWSYLYARRGLSSFIFISINPVDDVLDHSPLKAECQNTLYVLILLDISL